MDQKDGIFVWYQQIKYDNTMNILRNPYYNKMITFYQENMKAYQIWNNDKENFRFENLTMCLTFFRYDMSQFFISLHQENDDMLSFGCTMVLFQNGLVSFRIYQDLFFTFMLRSHYRLCLSQKITIIFMK